MKAFCHPRLRRVLPLASSRVYKRSLREPSSSAPVQLSDAHAHGTLTEEQKRQFTRDGFLAIEGFASKEECNELKAQVMKLVDAFDPHEISFFSSTNQETTTNQYFLDSAGKISFFFEEDSFNSDGSLVQPKVLSINKCGHALHDLDPVFQRFSRSSKMQNVYRSLGFRLPLPVQSMYIFKQPKIGGPVVPHEDSSFLTTEPPSCVGVWLAIDDATVRNGCLHIARGSHRDRVLKRMTRTTDDTHGAVGWPEGRPDYSDLHLEPLETPAGTLVLLHGSNVHGSEPNTSKEARHAYSMHVVEGGPGYEWLQDNWLQRPPDLPFESLYDDVDPA